MRFAIVAMMLAGFTGQAQAATLLTGAGESQLENWLAQGNLDFTNIFMKSPSDTSETFHAAVDGMGPTITLIQVLGNGAGVFSQPVTIGGYNPVSWNSSGGYNYSPNDYDRTAFIFNMSANAIAHQNLSAHDVYNSGNLQTYNRPQNGPTFGGGNDIAVSQDLTSGSTSGYSYDTWATYVGFSTNDILGSTWLQGDGSLSIGAIEVYTFVRAPSVPATVTPEPTSMALAGFAGIGMAVGAWRRRRQEKRQAA